MNLSQVRTLLKDTDRDTIEELIKRFDEGLVWEYFNQGYSLNDMDEAYQGEWNSDEEFVQELIEDTGDLPQNFPNYIHIDWERTAHDIMMDYYEINGHYFRSF